MEINTNILEIHFDKENMPVSININADIKNTCITFRRGKYDDGQNVGGIKVHLGLDEIYNIIEHNRNGRTIKVDGKEWVYTVLGNYIIQMLFGYGNILHPEIKPLAGHENYFRKDK